MGLRGRDLAFSYVPGAPVLDGVDLAFEPGALVCLLGPNGAGKSTLLRITAGLLTPDRGEVTWGGRPLAALSGRERARVVAYVPQGLAAVPFAKVSDFVLGGRYAHLGPWRRPEGSDREAVESALVEADVLELAERGLHEVSGGQLQRVLLARALAQAAPVLAVDEPTSSLDPQHQLAVFETLARLAGAGRAVCVVTHDFNLAAQYATELHLLSAGRVVSSGAPREVLTPAALTPVYGPDLCFGELPGAGPAATFVLPRRRAAAED